MQSTKQGNVSYTAEMTLHDLFERDHRLSVIFERYRLNYCCNGARSLMEACAENGVEAQEVLSDITRLSGGSFAAMPTSDANVCELLSVLYEVYERRIQAMLRPVTAKLQKVARSHGCTFLQTVVAAETMAQLADELPLHLWRGKEVLCWRVREVLNLIQQGSDERAQVSSSTLEHLLYEMRRENRLVQWYLSEIRDFTSRYHVPEGACMTLSVTYRELDNFDQVLSQFLAIEEDVLIPRLLQNPSTW